MKDRTDKLDKVTAARGLTGKVKGYASTGAVKDCVPNALESPIGSRCQHMNEPERVHGAVAE